MPQIPADMPTDMMVVEIASPGGPEMLRPARRPLPRPEPGEILIRVEAAGVNRPDIHQRQGHYPPPPGVTDIPGLEVAGRVAALGASVENWKIGERVCALLAGGGYAEYATAPEPQCLPVPRELSIAQAAALPETVFTCWTNLVDGGRLGAGQTVLIHGGSSGIGTTGIQLAKGLGATVFVTAGSAAKCDACQALGADLAIDYKTQDFVTAVKQATGGRGVDVVLDMVGGDYVPRNIECLAPGGRHVSIAALSGAETTIPIFRIMQKRLILTGSTLRTRSIAEKGAIAQAVKTHVWPLIEDGGLRPRIHATFGLAEAAQAHAALEAENHIGKILLIMPGN